MKETADKFTVLTTGKIETVISKMAIPTIISMLVTAIYNMADTFFVSNIKDVAAPAAVGVFFSIMALIQAVVFSWVRVRAILFQGQWADKIEKPPKLWLQRDFSITFL